MTISTPPAPAGLARSVWKLLRLQALITYNNIRRAKLRRKIGYGFLTLLVIAVLVGVFAGSRALLGLLQRPEFAQFAQANELIRAIPVIVLTVSFLVLLVASFGVLLQSLYLSGDMEFLLSAPVSIRAVFVAKLIEAVLPDFGLVCLFGLPILFGIGAARGYSPLYYPLVLLVIMTLALAVSGLASLLVMSVVRVVPARRVAELLGFFGAIISIICSQSGQLANTLRFAPGQVSNSISVVTRFDVSWSPLSWAARGLVFIATGQWLVGTGLLFAYLFLTVVVFSLALVTAERLYYTGWSRVQVGTRRRRPVKSVPDERTRPQTAAVRSPMLLQAASAVGWLPAPTRALLAKDYRVLTRDLRNMSQVVTPLLFGIIYAFAITRTGPASGDGAGPERFARVAQSIAVYGRVAIALFVSWGLLSRLALISFSQEGPSYWMIKTTPARPRQILLAKFLVAYLPGLLLGLLFLSIISILQHADLGITLYSSVMLCFSLAGAVGVNLAFGVAGANLRWQNPRAMMRGTMGCVASIASLAYMVAIVVLFFGPPVGLGFLGIPQIWGLILGMTIGIIASLAGAVLPPLFVLNRIEHIGEED